MNLSLPKIRTLISRKKFYKKYAFIILLISELSTIGLGITEKIATLLHCMGLNFSKKGKKIISNMSKDLTNLEVYLTTRKSEKVRLLKVTKCFQNYPKVSL